MNEDKLNKLIELRDRIKELKVVKCRLNHERVRVEKTTKLPIFQNLPEKVYERIGFCGAEIRRERISCGHTMSRYTLENALDILDSEESETENLRVELNKAADRIHALDHRKGDAEKRLAELIEKKHFEPENFSPEDLEGAKEEIRSIEKQHDRCIEKIADIHKRIITELENSLKLKYSKI